MTFEEYVLARGPALARFARLLTGDDHRAEDLAQDVLAKAYVRWPRIADTDRPDLYVRRMLVNAHRRRGRLKPWFVQSRSTNPAYPVSQSTTLAILGGFRGLGDIQDPGTW